MKMLKLMLLLLVSTTTFFACQKDDEGQPTDTVEGLWIGNYGFGNDNPDIFFSFNIKPGGVIEEVNKNQGVKGTGTWELVGDQFTASYKWYAPYFTDYKVRATFDKAHGRLSGFWGYDTDDNGGKWNMHKEN